MSAEVVRLSRRSAIPEKAIRLRLEHVISVFRAIEAGNLLAALPDCPLAQKDHRAAMSLLAMAESELLILHEELTDLED